MSAYAERLRFGLSDSLVLARRNLSHVRQIPEKLIDVTVQPLMFVILFAYVFGGAIAVPGGNYHEYLMGGIFIQTLTFGVMGPATSMATDLGEGILDRFRSLPDGALGLPDRPRAGRVRRRAARPDRDDARRPRRRLAHPHRRARTPSPASACCCSSPSRCCGSGMLLGTRRALARRGHRDRLHRHLPADLRGQRVRARPGRCRACCSTCRRLEPGQRARRGGRARCSATRRPRRPTPRGRCSTRSRPALLWCVGLLAVAVPLAIAAYRRRTEVWEVCEGGHLGGAESRRGGGELRCMSSLRTSLTTAAVTLLALSPAAAMAAGSHAQPKLGGNPQMRVVDANHATLNFASDRLARKAPTASLDAKITFVNGARVSGLKAVGTHGSDIKYAATSRRRSRCSCTRSTR